MNKFILPSLLFISTSLFAQNPDGRNASVHITPMWNWGTGDYSRVTYVWYPPTQASDEQTVSTSDYGKVEYPYAFGLSATMKIPATSFLTLNFSYTFNQDFDRYGIENGRQRYFGQFWRTEKTRHSVSLTMSIYNLFSLYLE
jgi:hypothetical protein